MNENVIDYNVNLQKGTQLIVAGIFATTVSMGFSYLLRLLDIAAIDFGAQWGALLNNQIHPGALTTVWWLGLLWHAINGIFIFPLIFDYLGHRMILPARRQVKGMVYGIALWLLVSVTVAPLAGEGLFYRLMAEPGMLAATTSVAWLIYGVVLEGMTRVRAAHYLNITNRRAA